MVERNIEMNKELKSWLKSSCAPTLTLGCAILTAVSRVWLDK